MSRTDKDRPVYVRVNDPLVLVREDHDHRDGYCDLRGSGTPPEKPRRYWQCRRTLVIEKWFDEPRREDRRDGWYSPVRRRDREDAIRMMREYNSSGEVDDEKWLPRHHRHNCFNGGWWN